LISQIFFFVISSSSTYSSLEIQFKNKKNIETFCQFLQVAISFKNLNIWSIVAIIGLSTYGENGKYAIQKD
jgi:hypothetical protein